MYCHTELLYKISFCLDNQSKREATLTCGGGTVIGAGMGTGIGTGKALGIGDIGSLCGASAPPF